LRGTKQVETHTKGSEQYSENIVVITSVTTSSLVKSVAVMSMKMLVVSRVILVRSELICARRMS
jgi:hypothetical protein